MRGADPANLLFYAVMTGAVVFSGVWMIGTLRRGEPIMVKGHEGSVSV